ncbi:MAG TPA: hypothetical protein VLX68_01155 [Chitinivibrionales bacterium]|nr:hypothetical protein [Chitinivibrionales bacterium]
MFSKTKKILNVLLEHHKLTCISNKFSEVPITTFLITYGKLQKKTGIAINLYSIGPYLDDIATWCFENGYPPLNALAVNSASQEPGEGYDLAEGCSTETWEIDVERVIEYRGYPTVV